MRFRKQSHGSQVQEGQVSPLGWFLKGSITLLKGSMKVGGPSPVVGDAVWHDDSSLKNSSFPAQLSHLLDLRDG